MCSCILYAFEENVSIEYGRGGDGREMCAKRAKSCEQQKVQASRRSRPDGTRPLSLSLADYKSNKEKGRDGLPKS